MTYENPKLVLTFLGEDLLEGHSNVQTIDDAWIVNHSILPSRQLLNGLKSSSDQFQITLFRRCPSVEDIIATEGNIKAQLYDGETIIFTGFVSTSYSWSVTDHGEQALVLTIESIGTRLFSQPFIETGYRFFDCPASAAVYNIIHPLGLSIRSGDERKILQPVRREVDAGQSVRELLDSLFYECNAVYSFTANGDLCIETIDADTTGATVINSDNLYHLRGQAISLSKALRTYKGARVRYTDTATAENYLVYRNTSGQDQRHNYCHLKLGAGEWFDGAEIYTDAEWAEATADTFREPTLISAVNAASESSIVGSGTIINLSNANPNVVCETGITVQIEAVGGKWFKITAHNSSDSDKYIDRMDLYADIVYEKNFGVIRTQIDGPTDGKSLLEEELSWIHDKDNAQKHANLLAQYYKSCGAVYTFYSDLDITLGSVIELHDNVFSGLDVFVLVYAVKGLEDTELLEYKAVGVSTFDLDAPAYHGTTETAHQSGAQGPQGEPGATAEVQYAIGSSIVNPPGEAMQWGSADMLWGGDTMYWNTGTWGDEVPEMQRGQYIWMRTRIGDAPWQYTRLTGSTSWDAENLGVCTSATPTQSSQGLGLIPGDYFVAGATFTENGVTYNAGFAYYYTGSAWTELDLETEANAEKAQALLDKLISTNTQIPSSASPYSVWLWAKNFVTNTAVINNLFSQAITILTGGYIKGGDRYNTSGTIVDWTKDGFWFGANGKLMAALQSDGNGNTYVGTSVGANSNSPGSYNTSMGYASMFKATSGGNYNIAFGYTALHENQTGDNNVAIGYQALYYNTASENIGIGTNALVYNTSGTYDIGIGTNALYSNTSGSNNVAIGYQAEKTNTTGSENISMGTEALYSNQTGNYNIAIGYHALYTSTDSYNTAIGYRALQLSSSGRQNTAIGSLALSNNTANGNTAVGGWALSANTTGQHNVAVGMAAAEKVTTGSQNTAIGEESLYLATTGSYNVAIGYDSLLKITTGSYNIGIGNGEVYSATGSRQVRMNALIGLEFKSGRTHDQIFTALKSYFSTYGTVSSIGFCETGEVGRITYGTGSNGEYVSLRPYTGTTLTLYQYSSSTITSRIVVYFINPKLSSSTANDCLS